MRVNRNLIRGARVMRKCKRWPRIEKQFAPEAWIENSSKFTVHQTSLHTPVHPVDLNQYILVLIVVFSTPSVFVDNFLYIWRQLFHGYLSSMWIILIKSLHRQKLDPSSFWFLWKQMIVVLTLVLVPPLYVLWRNRSVYSF